jgi:hypothetical protein
MPGADLVAYVVINAHRSEAMGFMEADASRVG